MKRLQLLVFYFQTSLTGFIKPYYLFCLCELWTVLCTLCSLCIGSCRSCPTGCEFPSSWRRPHKHPSAVTETRRFKILHFLLRQMVFRCFWQVFIPARLQMCCFVYCKQRSWPLTPLFVSAPRSVANYSRVEFQTKATENNWFYAWSCFLSCERLGKWNKLFVFIFFCN